MDHELGKDCIQKKCDSASFHGCRRPSLMAPPSFPREERTFDRDAGLLETWIETHVERRHLGARCFIRQSLDNQVAARGRHAITKA